MNKVSDVRQSPTQILSTYLKERNFGPNEQLPPERQLAEDLNLTRSRLRTSLAKLEREGVIWRHVGQGTFMSPASETQAVSAPDHAGQPLETNPAEILEARLALEPQIAYFAAQRATGSDVDRLEEILRRSKASLSWDEWGALDKAFHLAIAKASKNQLLLKLLITIQESQTPRNWGQLSDLPVAMARRDHITVEHDAILHAIQARQAQEAAALMRQHLEEVRRALLGSHVPI